MPEVNRFASLKEVNWKMLKVLRKLMENKLQYDFEQWKIRMQQCIEAEEELAEEERN